jgi:hypothetical protein
MKTKLTTLCVALLLSVCLNAGEVPKPKKASAEFERMKTLVGTWKGKADIGQGPVDFSVQYRVIAAGSVVEERVFPDSPNEMVTMYFDNPDGKLALTHYCMMGNRPEMVLKTSDAKTLQFDFNKACGIDCEKESHMHALTIRFDDADTITSSCKALIDGKVAPEHATTMKRVKLDTAKK